MRGTSLLLAVCLAGCAGPQSGGRDGPPSDPIDLAAIPDAVPKAEPLSRYGNKDYVVWGKAYRVMPSAVGYVERGTASWYGKAFHGKPTSSGEPYDMLGMTAAHKSLPLPTYVRVTNLASGKAVVVRVNDRGPFVADRLIDLSYVAAAKLGITGTGAVEVQALTVPESGVVPLASPQGERADTMLAADDGWYLQAGAFGARGRAAALQTQLQMQLPPPWQARLTAGAGLWRLRVGPLPDRATALDLQLRLQQQGWEIQLLAPAVP